MPLSSEIGKIGGRLIAAARVACVVAGVWFVWTHNILPRLGFESLAGIFTEALSYVAVAWVGGAFIAFWVYFVVALADLPDATRFSLRAAAPAMWFVPSIVLLSVPVAGAVAASLFLIATATQQLIANWSSVESPARPEAAFAEPATMFGSAGPDGTFLSWSSAPVLMASLSAQAAAVAWLWHHPVRAAAFFALTIAILTSLSITGGAYRPGKPPTLPHSALSILLTFLLAVSLTFGGIAVRRGGGGSANGSAAAAGNGPPAGQPATSPSTELPPPADGGGFGGDFPGVILLPELKPYPTIFVPVPAAPARPAITIPTAVPKPLDIPFSGEYWMFRRPASRPPRQSVIRRGSATDLSFHTTDGWPMEMEAHQKLDTPIGIACCREIQLAIRSTDPHPETVSVELVLVDSALFPAPGQSLGSLAPVGQVLTYRVPPDPAVRKFDDLKVIFHRDPARADKSARISIDRFILVP